MKRKFNTNRFGKVIKVVALGWVILWIGIGIFGLTGYFVKNCQSVQKEYNEQLSNFTVELQESKKAELNIEFEKEYSKTHPYTLLSDRKEVQSADEYLLKESARQDYLKQKGIGSIGFINDETRAENSNCKAALSIGGSGFLLGIPVLILYILFLYLFPRAKEEKVE